jgi:hypothetical protein
MSKYKAIYDRKGLLAEYQDEELVWVREELDKHTKPGHQIMLDIQPYKSMVDGSMITSRSKHREHLRRHNCFEVGNESNAEQGSAAGVKGKAARCCNSVWAI